MEYNQVENFYFRETLTTTKPDPFHWFKIMVLDSIEFFSQ